MNCKNCGGNYFKNGKCVYCQTSQSFKNYYSVGDYVRIKRRNHGHFFEIGEVVMVSEPFGDHDKDCCDVYSPGWQNNGAYSVFNKEGHCMNVTECEIEMATKQEFHEGVKERTFVQRWPSGKTSDINMFKAKDPSVLLNWDKR